jgi:seryl-tRNA synthetase
MEADYMLDLKFVRGNPQKVQEALASRGSKLSLKEFLQLDEQRREKLFVVEQMKNRRNVVSEEIGRLKKAGKDAPDMVLEMRDLSRSIKEKDEEIKEVEGRLQEILLDIPNIPHESVPVGESAADNPVVRQWGKPRDFGFTPKPHWEIGENLNILDFERGGKVTGARFLFYKGLGAKLERAVISFMLDLHTSEHGYTEIFPPFMVNRDSMIGTGQLPKFAEDMFKIEGTEYYLIPTAEVR